MKYNGLIVKVSNNGKFYQLRLGLNPIKYGITYYDYIELSSGEVSVNWFSEVNIEYAIKSRILQPVKLGHTLCKECGRNL